MKSVRALLSLLLTAAMLLGIVGVADVSLTLPAKAEEASYVVLDDCDSNTNFSWMADTVEKMQGNASLRISFNGVTTLQNEKSDFRLEAPNYLNTGYLEMWLYVESVNDLNLNNCSIELRQGEGNGFTWRFRDIGIKKGWNKLMLSVASANKSGTVSYINQLCINLSAKKTLTVRIDDVCLARSSTAQSKAALQGAISAAEEVTEEMLNDVDVQTAEDFEAAVSHAKEVNEDDSASQREVDLATAALTEAVGAFNFGGFTLDGAADSSYVDFGSMTYGLMDSFSLKEGENVSDYVGNGAVAFTEGVRFSPAASYVTANDRDLRFTLRYFDGESGGLTLRYGSTEGEKIALTVTFEGTQAWRFATVRVRDAALASSFDGDAVSIEVIGDAAVYLTRIDVQVVDAAQLAESDPPTFAPQTETNNLIGAAVAGYQMWFQASDNDLNWVHWGQGSYPNPAPGNGNVHVEIYPYVQDYIDNGATLYETNLGELGNGEKSLLFTSKDREVVETHFQWISEYGIDCLAVQRFGCGQSRQLSEAENHLCTVRDMAEKYNKTFYVMYDFTHDGERSYDDLFEALTTDMVYNVERSGVSSSPAYAHADGKPVVCLWGISGDPTSRYPAGYRAQRIIAWLQERGYYVIVGTPDYSEQEVDGERVLVNYTQRTGEWLAPFVMADMISPWTVGRYNYSNCLNWISQNVPTELAFCEKYGIAYLPVIYPGFSWSNMQDNGPPNHYPRHAGDFVWRQARAFTNLGIGNVYFAMFDEYDEGTAYMKGAADYFEIPQSQYFVTYAADGRWLSNDYYLRVAGKVAQLFKGETDDTKLNIPYSQGPVYWRNSFERRWTTYVEAGGAYRYTILCNVDVCTTASVTLDLDGGSVKSMADQSLPSFLTEEPTVDPATYATKREGTGIFRDASGEYTKSGEWAFHIDAEVTSNDAQFSHVFAGPDTTDVMISAAGLQLSYSLYAETELGKNVFVELYLDDGTQLSVVAPSFGVARGEVGKWVDVTVTLPSSLVGKHITLIAIGYRGGAGEVKAVIDDIVLQSPGTADTMLRTAVDTAGRLPESEALAAAMAQAEDVLNSAVSTDSQRLAAMRAIDDVIRTMDLSAAVALGDVDGDGDITSTDARLTLQYYAGKIGESDLNVAAADVDGDETITSTDARLILQYYAGKITAWP